MAVLRSVCSAANFDGRGPKRVIRYRSGRVEMSAMPAADIEGSARYNCPRGPIVGSEGGDQTVSDIEGTASAAPFSPSRPSQRRARMTPRRGLSFRPAVRQNFAPGITGGFFLSDGAGRGDRIAGAARVSTSRISLVGQPRFLRGFFCPCGHVGVAGADRLRYTCQQGGRHDRDHHPHRRAALAHRHRRLPAQSDIQMTGARTRGPP